MEMRDMRLSKNLENCRCYLVGSIEAVTDEEAIGWRDLASKYLSQMGVTVFDPTRKNDLENLNEVGEERARLNYLKQHQKWDEFSSLFKKIAHADLRSIDHSDFIIAKIQNGVPMVGSIHEIVEARRQKKKVFVFTEDKIEKTNCWLLWLVKPENVFENLEDIIEHLGKQTPSSLNCLI